MQEKLKALAELQKVDLEALSLRKASDVHPKQMVELERELGNARSAVEAERNRMLDVERQRRTLEQNIVEEKDKVKKWEQRLAEQRSTREYAALAREIDIAKKANQTMAEELIELGRSLATVREVVRTKDLEFVERHTAIGTRMTELRGMIEAFAGQVKELEGKRKDVAAKVDATLLRRYESVRKKKMPALVTVIAGTCQGCNMNIPPQQYNILAVSLGTDICPSCNRIICAAAALEGSSAIPPSL